MPVKIDSYGLSPHPFFDCDVLSELKEISDDLESDICQSSPCEDIWKKFDDFLLTPPQSPPIKFDLVSDLVDFSSVDVVNDNTLLHNADVLHDCMWSGQCIEDNTNTNTSHNHNNNCSSNSIRICNRNHSRPETPFSTSPLTMSYTFNDLLSTCDTSSNDSQSSMDDMDEDFISSSQDSSLSTYSSSSNTSFAKVKESLINDHSYGGSVVISHNKNNKKFNNNYETQSLIYPKHKVQTRVGNKVNLKCRKINGNKVKIIKANSPMSSPVKQEQEMEKSMAVPTVKIMRNDKHFVKSKGFISLSSEKPRIGQQKQCKFSTRRKVSSVSSERSVMFAQNHQFIQNNYQQNERLSQSDDEDINDDNVDDKSTKTVPPLRRREHNDSERKRRDHLRNAFINLKDQIPKLKSAEKRPPRIMILHEATSYVCHLNDKQKYLERTLNAEVEKRERLLKILSNDFKTESK